MYKLDRDMIQVIERQFFVKQKTHRNILFYYRVRGVICTQPDMCYKTKLLSIIFITAGKRKTLSVSIVSYKFILLIKGYLI